MKIKTPQFDPRFPNQNQTYNCFVNYVDYHRCMDLFKHTPEKCTPLKEIFQSLCPHAWVEHWDEQREAGTFPRKIVRVASLAPERKRRSCK